MKILNSGLRVVIDICRQSQQEEMRPVVSPKESNDLLKVPRINAEALGRHPGHEENYR